MPNLRIDNEVTEKNWYVCVCVFESTGTSYHCANRATAFLIKLIYFHPPCL